MLSVVREPAGVPSDRPVRIVASRSRPPATLGATVERLGALLDAAGVAHRGVEVVDVGSVGAKVNEILCDRADAYVHDTGFYVQAAFFALPKKIELYTATSQIYGDKSAGFSKSRAKVKDKDQAF